MGGYALKTRRSKCQPDPFQIQVLFLPMDQVRSGAWVGLCQKKYSKIKLTIIEKHLGAELCQAQLKLELG